MIRRRDSVRRQRSRYDVGGSVSVRKSKSAGEPVDGYPVVTSEVNRRPGGDGSDRHRELPVEPRMVLLELVRVDRVVTVCMLRVRWVRWLWVSSAYVEATLPAMFSYATLPEHETSRIERSTSGPAAGRLDSDGRHPTGRRGRGHLPGRRCHASHRRHHPGGRTRSPRAMNQHPSARGR
jgi:hypothetical protein